MTIQSKLKSFTKRTKDLRYKISLDQSSEADTEATELINIYHKNSVNQSDIDTAKKNLEIKTLLVYPTPIGTTYSRQLLAGMVIAKFGKFEDLKQYFSDTTSSLESTWKKLLFEELQYFLAEAVNRYKNSPDQDSYDMVIGLLANGADPTLNWASKDNHASLHLNNMENDSFHLKQILEDVEKQYDIAYTMNSRKNMVLGGIGSGVIFTLAALRYSESAETTALIAVITIIGGALLGAAIQKSSPQLSLIIHKQV